MTDFSLHLVPCGSGLHLSDVADLRDKGLPIPHNYKSWPLHHNPSSWLWCRALYPDGQLLAVFAIEISRSRALPGMRIARIERIGRSLHEGALPHIGAILKALAERLPRLLRLDVQVFDENRSRLDAYRESLRASGAHQLSHPRSYERTLVLPLGRSDIDLLAGFSARTRRNLRRFERQTQLAIESISDVHYADRIVKLHEDSFRRTGGQTPDIDVRGMLADAKISNESSLIGVFRRDLPAPQDLVAFGWGRLHGDYAVYDMAGAERGEMPSNFAPGAAVMWALIGWARDQGASWFDLGGITPPALSSADPRYGISVFKRGFSSNERNISCEFRFEPNRLAATLAKVTSGTLPFLRLSARIIGRMKRLPAPIP